MDVNKYDLLRKKNNKKDFEESNRGLDWWLFRLSFLGNMLSIFFSIFLVYPGLLKAINIHIIDGFMGEFIAAIITILILVAFEVIKRYVIRNFSNEYVKAKMRLASTSWLLVSIVIIILSFYISIIGSKNLGNIGTYKKNVVENLTKVNKDSITQIFEAQKTLKLNYIQELIELNKAISQRIEKTPIGWESIKAGYRSDIDKNDKKIDETKNEINLINAEYVAKINALEIKQNNSNINIDDENIQNIILFIFIAILSEFLIFGGIYFREWYEFKLLVINEQKFEKFYLKRDRYRTLITFIYGNGKINVGDKVISGLELKELIKEKTTIIGTNKLVDEFLKDMDNVSVFNTVGKRRYISKTYQEALDIVESFDDSYRILENMK